MLWISSSTPLHFGPLPQLLQTHNFDFPWESQIQESQRKFLSDLLFFSFCFSTSEGPQNVPSYLNQKSECHAWSLNGPHNLHSTSSNSLLNLSLCIARATALVHRPLLFLQTTKKNSAFVSRLLPQSIPHIILMKKISCLSPFHPPFQKQQNTLLFFIL